VVNAVYRIAPTYLVIRATFAETLVLIFVKDLKCVIIQLAHAVLRNVQARVAGLTVVEGIVVAVRNRTYAALRVNVFPARRNAMALNAEMMIRVAANADAILPKFAIQGHAVRLNVPVRNAGLTVVEALVEIVLGRVTNIVIITDNAFV